MKNSRFFLVFGFFLIYISCIFQATMKSQIMNGMLDLSSYSWNKPIALKGQWDFTWNRIIHEPMDSVSIMVPGHWGQLKDDQGESLPGKGVGTYFLEIKGIPAKQDMGIKLGVIPTSYRLYIQIIQDDNQYGPLIELVQVGRVSQVFEQAVPMYAHTLIPFRVPSKNIRLILQVANHYIDKGGLSSNIVIGTYKDIFNLFILEKIFQILVLGSLLFFVVQYAFHYSKRPKEKALIYFALFCLLIFIREFLVGKLQMYMPGWDILSPIMFILWQRIEFFVTWFMPGVFLLYLRSLFPKDVSSKVIIILIPFSFFMGVLVLIGPFWLLHKTIHSMNVCVLATAFYSCFVYTKTSLAGREDAKGGLWGIVIFTGFIIQDVLQAEEIIQSEYLLSYGFLAFLVGQALLMSIKYQNALLKAETLNNSLYRFVPQEMIQFLGKDSILDVKLGDAKKCNMTVLFSDIRNFTTLSENLKPEETFNFLNSYLSKISPAIRKYGGFIDKYLGDGILALFPGKPIDGINASLEIQEILKTYNQHSQMKGLPPIAIGIGIHTGSLILGTIGENERIDGTVIADSVNVSSRLEELTKKYSAEIIISQDVQESIQDNSELGSRLLGHISLRGRSHHMSIYQVMRKNDKRLTYKKEFEDSVLQFHSGNFKQAKEVLTHLLKQNPQDRCIESILKRKEFS